MKSRVPLRDKYRELLIQSKGHLTPSKQRAKEIFEKKIFGKRNFTALGSFLTHEDKVQVRYVEGTKFLCVSSNFDCFSNKR